MHIFRNDKRKKVEEMTEREHRITKKKWKSWKVKSREKQRIDQQSGQDILNTPPATPEPGPSGNARRGRKVVLRHKSKCVRENKKLKTQVTVLEEIIRNEKRKVEKFKKRLQRLNKAQEMKLNLTPESELTPNSKTKKMLIDLHNDLGSLKSKQQNKRYLMKSSVARTLQFHNTMLSSIKDSYMKTKSKAEKHHIRSALSSELIQRYRLRMAIARTMGLSSSQRIVQQHHQKENLKRFQVESFFLSSDVSRTTAGMKETITRKKIKKQKRYLIAPMKTLFKKFTRLHNTKISYTTFTRYRPFYVLKPSEISRDTCLCKRHTNIALKTAKLRQLKLISDYDPHNLYPQIVCDKTNAMCMYNMCDVCKTQDLHVEPFNKDDEVKWEKWVTKKEMREKKRGKEKVQVPVQITSKLTVNGTIGDLVAEFQCEMKHLKKHAYNIKMQNKACKEIKGNLKETEAVVHADFSENFACKFTEEIQCLHFGGSRQQVSLHTGILYVYGGKPVPFATVSPSRDHGPPAIWAHLSPILKYLRKSHPKVTTVHFFSDGPSSQYKQKNNFYLFSTLVYQMGFKNSTWSFFESSHGKGAPDGVGGALKRLANHYVAHGCDIPDPDTFFKVLSANSKIKMFFVLEEDIVNISKNLPNTPLKTVAGTREIHQLVTSQRKKICYRPVSCFCKENNWETGKLCTCNFPSQSLCFDDSSVKSKSCQKKIKKSRYEEIYSTSDSDEDIELQDTDGEMTLEDLRDAVTQEEARLNLEMLEIPCEDNIIQGTFVLVDLLGVY